MGEVWLATEVRLGRKVALKLLPADLTQDPARVSRFEQEARAASALNHPNVCTILALGQTADGQHYIAMEYVEGETLRKRLASAHLTIRDSLDIAIQIASALTTAHAIGIVHRDIKPENVMLRLDGFVKVLDFGLAKLVSASDTLEAQSTRTAFRTDPGHVVGTIAYMSPEQARGQQVDPRTDIWSLGVMLYEMLAGQSPFAGPSGSDVVAAILEREPAPLARFEPSASAELQRIVTKTLRKECAQRYQTVQDLALDLRALRGELDTMKTSDRIGHTRPDVGEEQVRRVSLPIASTFRGGLTAPNRVAILALAVVCGVMFLYLAARFSAGVDQPAGINSIAVLPFDNASGPETEYLSDGLAESLIDSLSQVRGLKVVSSNAVGRYRRKQNDAVQVGRELNVRGVVTGSVRQTRDRVVVTISLDDARDNRRIWGDQYERRSADLLTLQREIAHEIVGTLQLKISASDESRLMKRYTNDPDAYQLYLKGMYEWRKHTLGDFQKAIQYYHQSLVKDPNFALAYFGLSAAYGALGNNYWKPSEGFPKAKAYAARALALDDTLAEAHVAMAAANLYYDWDFQKADWELERARRLDPRNANALHIHGDYCEVLGRFDEAKADRKQSIALDPLSPNFNMVAGATLYFAREYDAAVTQLEQARELEPRFLQTYLQLGQAYEQKGDLERAIQTYRLGIKQTERHPQLLAALAHSYSLAGASPAATRILGELRDISKDAYVSPLLMAIVYAGLGDDTQTYAWLDRAVADRSSGLLWLGVEPQWDRFRTQPRFQAVLRAVGLAVPS